MVTLKQIEEFIASEPIAMVGVSRDPKKFGFAAFRELKEKGMNIIPINPYTEEIHGSKVYHDLKSMPSEVKGIIIVTPKAITPTVVKEAKEAGIKQIWIQQNADTKEAVSELQGTDINLITGQCILMYYKPHSIHKFHGRIKKIFGRFPK
jgi:uncharacterized protein